MNKMYQLTRLICLISLLLLPFYMQAQSTCSKKDTKKRAKILAKDDWKACPTCPSLETMFKNACERENALTENGTPRYLFDAGSSKGPTMNTAKLKATNSAKFSIAGQVTNEIKAKLEQYVAINELEQAAVDEMVAKIENWVITALPNVKPMIRMYRQTEDGRFEYQVSLMYDLQQVEEDVKTRAKAELKKALREEAKNMFNSDDFVEKTIGK